MTPLPRLSLFQIESELLGLLAQREDAEFRREEADQQNDEAASNACDNELQIINLLIRQYLIAEVRKADNITAVLRELDARAEARLKESDRIRALAEKDAANADSLRNMVIEIMGDEGLERVEGLASVMYVQNNGGVRRVDPAQPEMIPKRFKRATLTMSCEDLDGLPTEYADKMRFVSEEIVNSDVRKILEAAERSEAAIEILAETEGWTPGQKAQRLSEVERVPGCRLEPRGKHLRLK